MAVLSLLPAKHTSPTPLVVPRTKPSALFDELASLVSLSQSNPGGYYSDLNLERQFHPDTKEVEKREADGNNDKRWCEIRGQSCWKHKRSEVAARDPEAHDNDKRWCEIRGQSCWKAKRAAEAVISAIDSAHEARDLPSTSVARAKRDPAPWCEIRGQSCWKREAAL